MRDLPLPERFSIQRAAQVVPVRLVVDEDELRDGGCVVRLERQDALQKLLRAVIPGHEILDPRGEHQGVDGRVILRDERLERGQGALEIARFVGQLSVSLARLRVARVGLVRCSRTLEVLQQLSPARLVHRRPPWGARSGAARPLGARRARQHQEHQPTRHGDNCPASHRRTSCLRDTPSPVSGRRVVSPGRPISACTHLTSILEYGLNFK